MVKDVRMATVYSWVITQLECYPEHEGYNNVVFNIHWRRLAVNDAGVTVDTYGAQTVLFDSNEPFTPFADLTKAQAERWLEDTMGAFHIADIDAKLDVKLHHKANPVIVSPELPWNV